MKRLAALASTLVALAACAQPAVVPNPAASPPPAHPLAGFGWFAELGGACWQGDHPGGRTSDTQCYLAQFERLMAELRIIAPAIGRTICTEPTPRRGWAS